MPKKKKKNQLTFLLTIVIKPVHWLHRDQNQRCWPMTGNRFIISQALSDKRKGNKNNHNTPIQIKKVFIPVIRKSNNG